MRVLFPPGAPRSPLRSGRSGARRVSRCRLVVVSLPSCCSRFFGGSCRRIRK